MYTCIIKEPNYISRKKKPKCYAKSPTVQHAFLQIPGLISCMACCINVLYDNYESERSCA